MPSVVTLPRTIIVLVGALAIMLAVVALLAETTRVQYEQSQADRRAEELLLRLRGQELELARLRNPALIREKLADLRLGTAAPVAADGSGKQMSRGGAEQVAGE